MTERRLHWIALTIALLLPALPSLSHAADPPKKADADASTDLLASILSPHLKSTVDVVLHNYRTRRKYPDDHFPTSAKRFDEFRAEIVARFAETLQLQAWMVRKPQGKASPIGHRDHVHPGGDTMPDEAVIKYFQEQFAGPTPCDLGLMVLDALGSGDESQAISLLE